MLAFAFRVLLASRAGQAALTLVAGFLAALAVWTLTHRPSAIHVTAPPAPPRPPRRSTITRSRFRSKSSGASQGAWPTTNRRSTEPPALHGNRTA